jgi:hypothetical protein
MCAKLDLEVRCKRPRKREDRLIFINFGVKKFIVKNTPKIIILMFECYNFINPMEFLSYNILRLISNKVTSRSYSYFLKVSYLYFLRN